MAEPFLFMAGFGGIYGGAFFLYGGIYGGHFGARNVWTASRTQIGICRPILDVGTL